MTKAERAERKAWLDGLKPGDEVAVGIEGGLLAGRLVKSRNDGTIVVANEYGGENGYNTSNGRSQERSDRRMIFPITDEVRASDKLRKIRNRLRLPGWGFWQDVGDEAVLKIWGLLEVDKSERERQRSHDDH